jgi:predicted phage terminase large subunit-like protein
MAAADPGADQWAVLSFPAIADGDKSHRRAGEALDPERYPLAELLKIKASIGARKFEALYQQRPTVQGGNMIRASWLSERYTCRPEDIAATADEVWISVDAAKKKGSLNDFHAIHVWARKGAKKYLLDRRTERMGYPEFEDALDGMIAKWRPFIVRTAGGALIEDTANGTTYLQVRAHNSPVPLVGFSPVRDTPGSDSSKTARAIYLQRACEALQVVLPDASVMPTVEEVVICWTAFPSGLHDDDVDAASQIVMRWMLGEATPDLAATNRTLASMFGFG